MTMDVNITSTVIQSPVKLDSNSTGIEVEQQSSAVRTDEASKTEDVGFALNESENAEQDLHDVANELSDMMSLMRKGLAFKVDEQSGQSIVSVMDVDSGDLIRQIPNEEALELAQKLAEVAGSLLKTEA
ncbi:flagella locus protein FlaG [Shewanella sairae]|uniref:Flagella locus protein FlaG n=2 Tax=Shewanella sairae TaxID=190310 RepID=A0ABQ4PPR0_9GAMM|nr:flagella locus protein FlaG [Shewanella sairae]